jgi:hypothetical protein
MRIKLFLLCLFLGLAVSAHAQSTPKVVITGDGPVYQWQQTSQFLANKNWIGAGLNLCCYTSSYQVVQDFQTNVINQHPAFVVIEIGQSDLETIHDPCPIGCAWAGWAADLQDMVQMAQKANIKIIIGNVLGYGSNGQNLNVWLDNYAAANNLTVVNFHNALCQCIGPNDGVGPTIGSGNQYETIGLQNIVDITPAGFALMTQLTEQAIATYGLTIKSGYLADVTTFGEVNDPEYVPPSNVNTADAGEIITFTPQAKYSDGVVRPLMAQTYSGIDGTWTSSNPFVMSVDQLGNATAYGPGQATISFRSASGVPFSPWTMTISPCLEC